MVLAEEKKSLRAASSGSVVASNQNILASSAAVSGGSQSPRLGRAPTLMNSNNLEHARSATMIRRESTSDSNTAQDMLLLGRYRSYISRNHILPSSAGGGIIGAAEKTNLSLSNSTDLVGRNNPHPTLHRSDSEVSRLTNSYSTIMAQIQSFELETGLTMGTIIEKGVKNVTAAYGANLARSNGLKIELILKEKIYDLATRFLELKGLTNQVFDKLHAVVAISDEKQDRIYRLTDDLAHAKKEEQKTKKLEEIVVNLDTMLQEEVRKRSGYEVELAKMKDSFDRLQIRYKESRKKKETKEKEKEKEIVAPVVIEPQQQKTNDYEAMMRDRDDHIENLSNKIKDLECEVDEWKVLGIKAQRRWEESEKSRQQLAQDNSSLSQNESTLRERNENLTRRLKETAEKLQQFTDIYQESKKSDDQRKTELEELHGKMEELNKQIETLARQRKQLQTEFSATIKQKQDLFDKCRAMESSLGRKDRDLEDCKLKLADNIKDYEAKLERCEERIFGLTEKLSEAEAKKNRQTGIDPAFIQDMENKLKAKEDIHMAEMSRNLTLLKEKDDLIADLQHRCDDLKVQQFGPRMERLRKIEIEIKDKIEDYALAEESLETQLLCSHCANILNNPCTLTPCGHSFCEECMLLAKEENYDRLYCTSCENRPAGFYKNETLDGIVEMFKQRKELSNEFLSWIHKLEMPDS